MLGCQHERILFDRRPKEHEYTNDDNPSMAPSPKREGRRGGKREIDLGFVNDFERGSDHDSSDLGDVQNLPDATLSFVVTAAYLLTPSFNCFISHLSSLPVKQKHSSRWSDRKKASY
jgi:hypothetical protein